MAIQTYEFLDKSSVKYLLNLLFTKANMRIDERIVNELNENSSDKQVLSAYALYDIIAALNGTDAALESRLDANDDKLTAAGEAIAAIKNGDLTSLANGIDELRDKVNGLSHLTIQTVTGPISTVVDPSYSVLYFQRDDENDITWMMYTYSEERGWIEVGDTELDLSTYWSKDETATLREALGIHDVEAITDSDIVTSVNESYLENAPDLRIKPTGTPNIAETIANGVALSAHPITGTMYNRSTVVYGTFSWVTPDEEFVGNVGDTVEATWMFTPINLTAYAPVTGVVAISIV